MKYYVVSDVHSFYDKLILELTEKGFFEDEKSILILCGDAFDRGDGAKKMQDFLVSLKEKNRLIYIRGNHEDLAIEFLENCFRYLRSKSVVYRSHHYSNGTVKTFCDLTGMSLDEMIKKPEKFMFIALNTPYISKLIPSSINYFETDNYVFVHGYIPTNLDNPFSNNAKWIYMQDWRDADAIDWDESRWFNGMELWGKGIKEPNKTIVCGHCRCSYGNHVYGEAKNYKGDGADYSPFKREGILAIDACTALSGKVNCIVIED